jgi:uncharacterized membrane protein
MSSTSTGEAPAEYPRPDNTTERLEIFSDGVIAIAITLLVLDIRVPEPVAEGGLFEAMAEEWPTFLAFFLSFVTIGLIWVAHHSMFHLIERIDRGLLFTNLLLLLFIAFLPFPTGLLAEFAREGGTNSHQAAAFYSATMAAIGFAFLGLWKYLERHPELLIPGVPAENVTRSVRRSLVGPLVYTASIALAFVSALACFVVYALMAVYFAWGPSARALLPGRRAASAKAASTETDVVDTDADTDTDA